MKTAWPELVGTDGLEAEKVIRQENSEVRTVVVKLTYIATMEYRPDRALIYVDDDNKVIRVPSVG